MTAAVTFTMLFLLIAFLGAAIETRLKEIAKLLEQIKSNDIAWRENVWKRGAGQND